MQTAQQIAAREQYTESANVIPVTVPAAGVWPIDQLGQAFYLIGCTSPVYIKTDQTPEKPYSKGRGERFPNQLRFRRLEIRNPNAYAVTLLIWIGFGEYIDKRFEVLDGYTVTVAQPTTIVPANGSVTLSGAGGAGMIQRKQVVVSNVDVQTTLQILDSAGNIAAAVFPQTSVAIPTSDQVTIKNPTAADVSAYISEIWYSEHNT